MARASKRAGVGAQRGSVNPKITVSAIAPSLPKKYDIWVDISTPATPVWNYWDGSAWQN